MKLPCSLGVFLCLCVWAKADTFLVAEFGTNTITRYDQNGTASSFTNAFVNGPNGIAIDSAGNVYVATGSNTIEEFSPSGQDLGIFAAGLNLPMGLAFDGAGNLYVANFGGGTVEKFTAADLGSVFAYVTRPTGLAFDSAGNLYVANFGNTIEEFAPDGASLGTFASTGLNNPEGLAFDSSGNLYVANNGSDTIEEFSPSGVDLGVFANTGLSGPIGLAFDSLGNLYVVNSRTATIEKFLPDGTGSLFASTAFSPTFIAVEPGPKLANISTRARVLVGDDVLDAGFIITGAGSKTLLIRGLGPSLTDADLTGTLADPMLELHGGDLNSIIATNDNWKATQQAEIAATGLAPPNDTESALLVTLSAGGYTVIERGTNGGTGIGLVEIYDLDAGAAPELANISTRGFVDLGDEVMIAGFIITGDASANMSVLVRGLGPSLGAAGVADSLPNPMLELHDGNGDLILANDDWKSDQQSAIEATGLPPPDDAESAMIDVLVPGAYTVIESGHEGESGVGLIDVYNLH